MRCADAKGVPGIKAQAKVHCKEHSPMAWAEPAMLGVASRTRRRMWVKVVGCPQRVQRDVRLEAGDEDGDQEKVESTE